MQEVLPFDEIYMHLRNLVGKPFDIRIGRKDSGEVVVSWELYAQPGSKSESSYFKEYKEDILKLDLALIDVAKICDKQSVPYSLKLCKSKRLEVHEKIPVLLTSFISMNFPVSETSYYMNNVNDDIPEAYEEINDRLYLGFMTKDMVDEKLLKHLESVKQK